MNFLWLLNHLKLTTIQDTFEGFPLSSPGLWGNTSLVLAETKFLFLKFPYLGLFYEKLINKYFQIFINKWQRAFAFKNTWFKKLCSSWILFNQKKSLKPHYEWVNVISNLYTVGKIVSNGCTKHKTLFPINSCFKFWCSQDSSPNLEMTAYHISLFQMKRHIWMTCIKVSTKFWWLFNAFK